MLLPGEMEQMLLDRVNMEATIFPSESQSVLKDLMILKRLSVEDIFKNLSI